MTMAATLDMDIMRNYEGLFILDMRAGEAAVEEIIARIEADMKAAGARVESVQRLDRRRFERVAGKVDHGFYVNFRFEADPASVDQIHQKFALNPSVFRTFFLQVKTTGSSRRQPARGPETAA